MQWFFIFCRGMAMGAADVVPGVSGGTIALITGIYERLIDAIKSFDKVFLSLLKKGNFPALWKHIDGVFLLTLFAGILVSVGSLAKAIKHLLTHEPLGLWSFFFGLILASIFLMYKKIKKWDVALILYLSLGIIIAYTVTIASPIETSESYWFIFFSGAIAICAMLLPGISGSFLLVLMGKYAFILGAITALISNLQEINADGIATNGLILLVFALGCGVGLLSFSRAISWALKKYWNITIALLSGFMIGSLNKVWPWKEIVQTYVDRHGVEKPLLEKSVLPQTYALIEDPQVFLCFLMMGIGLTVVLLIDKLSSKN